ncbi:MAG: hypothetical protein H7039_12180 [Bryobacteraceae bacterium]|nr:hypothetical protein [Bryobacteraceae bacterium]
MPVPRNFEGNRAILLYMRVARRDWFLYALTLAGASRRFVYGAQGALRGRLSKDQQGRAVLQTTDGKNVTLTGDEETRAVLGDSRLSGFDFEVLGTSAASGAFTISPIHLAALWAYQDGKRKRVTYWCDVCAIRTYSPGLCWCCREETALDLRDPDTVVGK